MTKQVTIQEVASLGGKARALALTAQQRSAIARTAATARWAAHNIQKAKLSSATPERPS